MRFSSFFVCRMNLYFSSWNCYFYFTVWNFQIVHPKKARFRRIYEWKVLHPFSSLETTTNSTNNGKKNFFVAYFDDERECLPSIARLLFKQNHRDYSQIKKCKNWNSLNVETFRDEQKINEKNMSALLLDANHLFSVFHADKHWRDWMCAHCAATFK